MPEHRTVTDRIHTPMMSPGLSKLVGTLASIAIVTLTTCSVQQRDTVMLYEQRMVAMEKLANENEAELEKREPSFYSIKQIATDVKEMRDELKDLTTLIRSLR